MGPGSDHGYFDKLLQRRATDESSSDQSSLSFSSSDAVEGMLKPPLLQLPPELLHQIMLHLQCQSLVSLFRTCRLLKALAESDLLWQRLLSPHIPADDFPMDSAYPSSSYRELYIAHHPYWFVPQYKIWISDEPHIGRIILCKYDPRRGCIEGYRLLAERGPAYPLHWSYKPSVVIHSFQPRVHLWLDDPVLKLPHEIVPFRTRQGWWEGEIKMQVGRPGHDISSSFFLSRNIPQHLQSPNMELWPPLTIPDMPRVRAVSQDKFRSRGHKPQSYGEISETTFRMRHWSQFSTGMSHFGVRIGEETSTWTTIDPKLYTPTKEKPYQGIYVGDYAGHGCEFLLIMQTEKAPPAPERHERSAYLRAVLLAMEGDEVEDDLFDGLQEAAQQAVPSLQTPGPSAGPSTAGQIRQPDESVFHGAIEAVKLTGDPNIPRGEHTFIADDIGPAGCIRIATEHPFQGARVVKSRGHVAARGFQNDEYIPSQLIMMSPNRLAQYWVPFGHISFYERIDIDQLVAGGLGKRASV